MIKPAPKGLGLKNPIIGWKKTVVWNDVTKKNDTILVMLQILGAHTINARDDGMPTRKRRTSKALVLAQFHLDREHTWEGVRWEIGDMFFGKSKSLHDSRFTYRTGQLVHPTKPFSLSNNACAPGIHYFENVDDAIHY